MSTTNARAQDFVTSLGINTHLAESGAGTGYLNAGTVLSQLQYLGVGHIRELVPGAVSAQQLAEAGQLAAAGIKFDLMMPGNGPVNLQADMALLDAFARAHPGAIASIEGPNEVDIWPISYQGRTGMTAAIAFQRDLYAAVHADPLLSGVPVYNFTLGGILPADAGVGNVAAYADAANVHTYAPNGIRPSWVVPAAIQGFAADVPNKPVVVTETNYYTLPQDSNWGGVSEAVQAAYGLDTALDDFKNGVSFTYFYELEDAGTDADREEHFGLFRADGSPKPFATALNRLTGLLADPGAAAHSFTPGTLSYSIANLPWTASSLALAKSSGVVDLAIWDEQALWDPVAHRQLAATTATVTLHLGQLAAAVSVYDPIAGAAAIAHFTNVQDVTLALSADPLIVEVTPQGALAAMPAPAPTPTPTPVPTPAPAPPPPAQAALKTITGNRDGGVTLAGTAAAGAKVTVTDAVNGKTFTIGTTTASGTGAWSLTSHARVDTSTVNTYRASASGAAGASGPLILTTTGHDAVTATPGVGTVFALMSTRGTDIINGFKTAQAAGQAPGAVHDVLDFSGRGITSFAQVQSMLSGSSSTLITMGFGHTLTLAGVNPHSLTTSDVRFS